MTAMQLPVYWIASYPDGKKMNGRGQYDKYGETR